jgi:hypothetical protein
MSRVSKSFAAIALSVVLTTGSAYAKPSQDPGTGDGSTIASRLVRIIKHLVKVVVGLDEGDDLSVPHP